MVVPPCMGVRVDAVFVDFVLVELVADLHLAKLPSQPDFEPLLPSLLPGSGGVFGLVLGGDGGGSDQEAGLPALCVVEGDLDG